MQVAVVTVAFPATPLLLARARICISASHSREDLVKALEVSLFFPFNFLWVFFIISFLYGQIHESLVNPVTGNVISVVKSVVTCQ